MTLCEVRLVCLIIFNVFHVLKENISLYTVHRLDIELICSRTYQTTRVYCETLQLHFLLFIFEIVHYKIISIDYLACILSKPIEYESQDVYTHTRTVGPYEYTPYGPGQIYVCCESRRNQENK